MRLPRIESRRNGVMAAALTVALGVLACSGESATPAPATETISRTAPCNALEEIGRFTLTYELQQQLFTNDQQTKSAIYYALTMGGVEQPVGLNMVLHDESDAIAHRGTYFDVAQEVAKLIGATEGSGPRLLPVQESYEESLVLPGQALVRSAKCAD